mmetsp:Transcript_130444/g.194178  ORF Transcript_130444/g.194178 Transcript_130444/m.194178 type:complete len:98 (-) Transcript_130444:672-965(-)
MAADLALFMHAFLAKHPELKGRDFFITGESYAGHYIPAAAYYFLFNTTLSVNLKGIAIGNGLVDPYNQYPAYADFAYENKLVGKIEYYALKAAFKVC